MAYSYCHISANSGAYEGDNLGTGALVTDGRHRCFDWFATRVKGFLHGESEVVFKQPSITAAVKGTVSRLI